MNITNLGNQIKIILIILLIIIGFNLLINFLLSYLSVYITDFDYEGKKNYSTLTLGQKVVLNDKQLNILYDWYSNHINNDINKKTFLNWLEKTPLIFSKQAIDNFIKNNNLDYKFNYKKNIDINLGLPTDITINKLWFYSSKVRDKIYYTNFDDFLKNSYLIALLVKNNNFDYQGIVIKGDVCKDFGPLKVKDFFKIYYDNNSTIKVDCLIQGKKEVEAKNYYKDYIANYVKYALFPIDERKKYLKEAILYSLGINIQQLTEDENLQKEIMDEFKKQLEKNFKQEDIKQALLDLKNNINTLKNNKINNKLLNLYISKGEILNKDWLELYKKDLNNVIMATNKIDIEKEMNFNQFLNFIAGLKEKNIINYLYNNKAIFVDGILIHRTYYNAYIILNNEFLKNTFLYQNNDNFLNINNNYPVYYISKTKFFDKWNDLADYKKLIISYLYNALLIFIKIISLLYQIIIIILLSYTVSLILASAISLLYFKNK